MSERGKTFEERLQELARDIRGIDMVHRHLRELEEAALWFLKATEALHPDGMSGLVVAANADGTNRGADHAGAEAALRAALALPDPESTEKKP